MALLAAFVFGAIVGSFLNVCIVRMPSGESVVFPGSGCRSCRKPIAWYDNVPIASWLLLKGKCRSCGAKFSPRYLAVEALTGALFAGYLAWFGLTPHAGVFLAFTLALLVESVIDLDHQIIPDAITLPGIAAGLAASAWLPGALHGKQTWLEGFAASFAGALAGGFFLYAAGTIAEKVMKKEAMGGGDVKLLAMIGAFTGLTGVGWTVFVGSFLGSVVGLWLRWRHGQERIPFGPYLGAAAVLYLFAGKPVMGWYFSYLTGS